MIHNHHRMISAKEIPLEFGISYQTLNSYTDVGLLDVIGKKNRIRFYNYTEVKKRLTKIMRLVNEGYTLRLICRMLKGGNH